MSGASSFATPEPIGPDNIARDDWHGRPASVYRLLSHVGEVIYVGLSFNVKSRVAMHRKAQAWAAEIAEVESREYPNRLEASLAEMDEIRRLRPRYNIAGNPDAFVKRDGRDQEYLDEQSAWRNGWCPNTALWRKRKSLENLRAAASA